MEKRVDREWSVIDQWPVIATKRGCETVMGWFDQAKKKIRTVNRWIAVLGAFFLIPMMLITAADVVGRDLFDHPLPGVVEISEYLLSIFILLGLGYAQQAKAHVGLSLVTSRLSLSTRFVLEMMTTLIGFFLFSILVWQGWAVGIHERTVSDMLRIPQYPFRLLVAVAAFLVCLELLIDCVESFRKLFGRSS
jgi:TRAP-type C4-dicarboxylate transport system permease small subunit